MDVECGDPIAEFYERHPYPPPVADLDRLVAHLADGRIRRADHHLVWPERPPDAVRSVLVAGCGTSQSVRHALRRPDAQVVGIDVSSSSLTHSRRLADHHGVTNLEVRALPIEQVAELDRSFDHVICTGVLHHLAEPAEGLAALRSVLAPRGAITLMVYAHHGRVGIEMVQDYCRWLGVEAVEAELADLVTTLRELPVDHPLSPLLHRSRDFHDDDALADALLNPRERSYTVSEIYDLLAEAGLRLGRWSQQAPYLPDCGSISETPHAERIARLAPPEQHAAVEAFRGTLTRHSVIAFSADDPDSGHLDFASDATAAWVPVAMATTVVVREGLPPGAAAALLNRSHPATDLVRFVDAAELAIFESIDGSRPVSALGAGAGALVERLWRHDLIVIDAIGNAGVTT